MAAAWYNSQILGVVVGAVLGFVLSYVPNKIEKHRDHLSFRKILKKEIGQVTLRMTGQRTTCVKCMDDITDRRLNPQNLMDRMNRMMIYSGEYPTAIFKSNLDKLIPFPERVAEDLVAFYALVDECQHRMAMLERENPPEDYIDPSRIPAGTPQYPGSLFKASQLLAYASQKGEELIKEIDNDIDRDWHFKNILRVLFKKISGIFVRR